MSEYAVSQILTKEEGAEGTGHLTKLDQVGKTAFQSFQEAWELWRGRENSQGTPVLNACADAAKLVTIKRGKHWHVQIWEEEIR